MQPICTVTFRKHPYMTLSERRLKFLHELFTSGKSFTKKELEEKVSRFIAPFRNREEINDNGLDISKRSVDGDIAKLRKEHKAPLVCVSRKYYYTNPKFTIGKPDIDPDVLQNIKIAATILKQIPGLKLYKDLSEIYEAIESDDVFSSNEKTYVQFDTRPAYNGSKYLIQALEACKSSSVISFDYQPFDVSKSTRVTLHPYLLKEYNNRWSLIGLTESDSRKKKKEINRYGLERIVGSIKNENIQFLHDPEFNPDEYLANVIGVSMDWGSRVENVVLRFTLHRAKYIETNSLHPTQKHIQELDTRTHKIFSYQLIPNKELEALILSFGPDVEVIEPISLRGRVHEKIKIARDLYL